jgi:iron complex outermembrane receptor protein
MRSTKQGRFIVAVVAVWVLGTAAPTLAQQEAPQAEAPGDAAPVVDEAELEPVAPEEEAPGGIEAITVVGERLSVTDVQDEAQAISAFSMEDLDQLNIGKVDDLARNVPGLHVGQQGQAAIITLRGIGTENASITGEAGVAFHVDGINYGRPSAARVAFFDLQSLDVKRGPQGLLGGKNSTSGSVNVVTNDPTDEYEIEGDVLFGNYDRVRARGAVNLPVGEFAAVRTAFFYEDRDGYLDNKLFSDSRDPFDADNFGLRSKLRLTPTDRLNMIFSYNYFREDGNGPQADLVPILVEEACRGRPRGVTTVMPRSLACLLLDTDGDGRNDTHAPATEDPDPREIYSNRRSSQSNRYWGTHGRIEWEVPELPLFAETTLELRGGYQRTETVFDWDFDSSDSAQPFNLDTDSLTHEYSTDVRWSGTSLRERLNWQASLFYVHEKSEGTTITPSITVSDPVGGDFRISSTELVRFQSTENKAYGAALHGELNITDYLTWSLGGRFTKDRKRSFLSRRAFLVGGEAVEGCDSIESIQELPDGTLGFPVPNGCDRTDRGTSWGSRLELRPLDGHLVYLGIDRGYKSGGFGLGGSGSYDPEKIWAYTAGLKSEFFDRRLTFNFEFFLYNYDDLQIALVDGTATRTENADARMYGWEVEASAEPLPGLNLRAVVGYLNSESRDYYSLDPASLGNISEETRLVRRARAEIEDVPIGGPVVCQAPQGGAIDCGLLGDRDGLDDFSGNELSRAPAWKYTLTASYEIPLGEFGFLTPQVQYAFQDDTFQRAFNRDFDRQEDYHTTDLKLIWRSPEDRWLVEAFVDNVEDVAVKDFILIGSRVFDSPPLAWYNEPRFYGIRVGFRY